MAMHDASYLRTVRALCDRYEVHLIADEIAVGCGRTGTFFACEQAGIWPDFVCLSKGISGGYLPLSLVLSRDAIYEAFLDDDVARGFLHSHSYTGNALACRAALAVLDRFEEDDVLERNRQGAAALSAALAPVQADPRIEHFRLMPPYVLDDELAGWLAQRVMQTLDAVADAENPHADRTSEPSTA
jgi:adenosylmethionine-8-amino-7-oxononanoate aminotransferase